MKRHQEIGGLLQRLVEEGEWIFAVGLRIRFNHPTLLYQTYPEEWVAFYAQNGLLFSDPAVLWGMTNFGVCDWSDLEAMDQAGVLRQARDFGLTYGIVVSVGDSASRSIGFFARPDAPVTAAQRSVAEAVMANLHSATEGVTELSAAELAGLTALNETLSAARS